MSQPSGTDHGWRGSSSFRVAKVDGQFLLRFAALTSSRSKLKSDIGSFFRKSYRQHRADYRPYDVHIWLEGAEHRRLDVDNVAKACLDALTGVLWRDDAQVVRLIVEKVPGERPGVVVLACTAQRPTRPARLEKLLSDADGQHLGTSNRKA